MMIRKMLNQMLLALVALFLLVGCSRQLGEDHNLVADVATPLPRLPADPWPKFLDGVHPAPASAQVMEAFIQDSFIRLLSDTVLESAICVWFVTFYLLEPGDDLTLDEAFNRLSIVVDGVVFNEIKERLWSDDYPRLPYDSETGEPVAQFEGGSSIEACFAVDLDPGLHTVTFVARKSSGEELRYTWSFILVETPQEAPPYERRPFSLSRPDPSPGMVMPVDQYRSDRNLGYRELPASHVCIWIATYYLYRDLGTRPSFEELVSFSYLRLNGVPVHEKESIDVDGINVEYQLCFPAELETGLHTATFVMRDAQENTLEYTWYFLLVE
jgi:hypothetical protein